MASGFSDQTCLPASSAARLTSKCARGIVRFTTMSIAPSASSSACVHTPGMPNWAARASARSIARSEHATTSSAGDAVMLRRYGSLTVPQPITPTLITFPLSRSHPMEHPHPVRRQLDLRLDALAALDVPQPAGPAQIDARRSRAVTRVDRPHIACAVAVHETVDQHLGRVGGDRPLHARP